MKILSFYLGHDSNVTYYDSDSETFIILELERVFEKRYFQFPVDQDGCNAVLSRVLGLLKKKGIDNEFEILVLSKDGPHELDFSLIKAREVKKCDHHYAHALGAYALAPHKEYHVLSYDGGGNDGVFNFYHISPFGIKLLRSEQWNLGWGYQYLSKFIFDVAIGTSHELALAGKTMGFAGYGSFITVLEPHVEFFIKEYFTDHSNEKLNKFARIIGLPANYPFFHSLIGASLAATAQKVCEDIVLKFLEEEGWPSPLCVTGGCALNILINQKLREHELDVFVPPNPSDCGLSFGQVIAAIFNKTQKVPKVSPITYSGLWLLDEDKLDEYIKEWDAKPVDIDQIANNLKDGKIIGLVQGGSEVGPRALGNRSLLCDPTFPEAKVRINERIKHREWYRPFAGVCQKDQAHKFFDIHKDDECDFMVFCPDVKNEFKPSLGAITHVDGTCRLQTVSKNQNEFLYNLLGKFDIPVLLNTSFNAHGKPILSTIESALKILEEEDLDGVIVKGFYFEK